MLGLLNVFVMGCDKFASNDLCASMKVRLLFCLFTCSAGRPFSPDENTIACMQLQLDCFLVSE